MNTLQTKENVAFLRRVRLEMARADVAFSERERVTNTVFAQCTVTAEHAMIPLDLLSSAVIRNVIAKISIKHPHQKINSDRVQFILAHHPTLRFTARQAQVFQLQNAKERGAQSHLARTLGVSRQNITNIAHTVRQKIEMATDLARLWDGEVVPFFQNYNTGWATTPIRTLLWSVFRPRAGLLVAPELFEQFIPLQQCMADEAVKLLEMELHFKRTHGYHDPQRLSLAYNILISAAHIKEGNAVFMAAMESLSARALKTSWIIHRFARRAMHLLHQEACEKHGEWLKQCIVDCGVLGRRFAHYAMAYYGGVDEVSTQTLLKSDGTIPPSRWNYEPIIAREYDNIRIPRYRSQTWDDVNFLRLALMNQHAPLLQSPLSGPSKQSIITICQKALHSQDLFVVRHAEQLLAEMAPHY